VKTQKRWILKAWRTRQGLWHSKKINLTGVSHLLAFARCGYAAGGFSDGQLYETTDEGTWSPSAHNRWSEGFGRFDRCAKLRCSLSR
jgi:hypothetical protein